MDAMVVYEIIAGLINQKLNCQCCVALRSPDGQSIMFLISNYPTFPHGVEMDIIVTYPFTWLNLSDVNGKIAVIPSKITFKDIRFWQGSIGTPFPHPHIWDSGIPDLGGNSNEILTIQDIVGHLIMTLRYANVNKYSILMSRLSSRSFGGSAEEVLLNTKKQIARVDAKFGLDPINKVELSQWLDYQFRLRVSILIR